MYISTIMHKRVKIKNDTIRYTNIKNEDMKIPTAVNNIIPTVNTYVSNKKTFYANRCFSYINIKHFRTKIEYKFL